MSNKVRLADRHDLQKAKIKGLSPADRNRKLQELHELLLERISVKSNHREFFDESYEIIDDLKALGFDLWSWSYDGEAEESYGWDYVARNNTGELIVTFHFPGRVEISWGDEANEDLSVESDS